MELSHFESYLSIVNSDKPELATSLRGTVLQYIKLYVEPFSFNENKTGLLLGKVQSGKTSQMLGIASAAADIQNGFRFFILLTPDNTYLHEQTIDRAFSSLLTFNICNETDDGRFRAIGFRKPTLVVLKKNAHVLRSWRAIIGGFPTCRSEPLMILDDEGDAASLNTLVNESDVSTINSLLGEIRDQAPSSIYVQVTATPQANLLQTITSGWRPQFVHLFEPGPGYLGGSYFYSEGSSCIRQIDEAEATAIVRRPATPEGLRKALLNFLVAGAYTVQIKKAKVNNLLIHPSLRTDHHEKVRKLVEQFLDSMRRDLKKNSETLKKMVGDICDDFRNTTKGFPSNEAIIKVLDSTLNRVNLIVLNMYTPSKTKYDSGLNVIIGGNSLGRGLTFPSLHTVYYTRQSRTPQADTVWQHSRIFGYDRERGLCRLFLPPSLANLFREFSDANEALFKALKERGIAGITLLAPPGTRPTRRSVLDQSALAVITGGVNYFPTYPTSENCRKVDALVGKRDREVKIELQTARRILGLVRVERADTMDIRKFIKCFEMLEAAGERRCTLVVRTEREITRGTGTLLSPNDRALVNSKTNETVLVVYRLTGKKSQGWSGIPLWVPNIKFSDDRCFYTGA